jgi:hypothetical protein
LSERVRHADRPTVEERVDIAAPPTQVWPHVSDIGLSVGVSDELLAVAWTSGVGDAPCVGRTFVGTNANKYFGQWQTTATVIECDEPRAFAWAVGDIAEPNTTWRYILEATSSGTRLTQCVQLGIGASGLTVAIARMPDKEERIVARRLEEFRMSLRRNLETIRSRVESG